MGPADTLDRFRVDGGDLGADHHPSDRWILDRSADARRGFFAASDFPIGRPAAARVGPALPRDDHVDRRGLRSLDGFAVDVRSHRRSDDGARCTVRNPLRDPNDALTAPVGSEGVRFDLEARRPRAPPADGVAVLRAMPRPDPYRDLANRRREAGAAEAGPTR